MTSYSSGGALTEEWLCRVMLCCSCANSPWWWVDDSVTTKLGKVMVGTDVDVVTVCRGHSLMHRQRSFDFDPPLWAVAMDLCLISIAILLMDMKKCLLFVLSQPSLKSNQISASSLKFQPASSNLSLAIQFSASKLQSQL